MNTLLILLLGGRIQPAMTLAFQLEPDAVALVVSSDNAEVAEDARRVLRARFPALPIDWPAIMVPAYRPHETIAALGRVADAHASSEVVVSLTGAPMPMGIGGYEFARRCGCAAQYYNSDDGEILDFRQPEAPLAHRARLSLDDYFLIYGLQPVPTGAGPEYSADPRQRAKAACMLGETGPVATALLAWLSRAGERPGAKRLRWSLGAAHWTVLARLQEHDLISRLRLVRDAVGQAFAQFRVARPGDIAFLRGQWLEEYVRVTAENAVSAGDEPLFDECRHGVKFRLGNAEREIDFVGIRRGAVLIASCKSGRKPWEKASLDELEAVGNRLGGNFCARLFITNQAPPAPPPGGTDPFEQFAEQAARAGVVVVSGARLARLSEILQAEVTVPTYRYRRSTPRAAHRA